MNLARRTSGVPALSSFLLSHCHHLSSSCRPPLLLHLRTLFTPFTQPKQSSTPPDRESYPTIFLQQKLETIVGSFDAPISYAVGYGSGVFKQEGYDDKDQ